MTSAALSSFRLDIVADTMCPWCYVGKRRLAAALPILEAEGLTFDVTWRPFQLNPTMPREGLDRRAYRSAKFGSWEKSQALDAQVTEAGASAGLVFRHDLMAKTPNTMASHALIRLAHETGAPPCRIASSKRFSARSTQPSATCTSGISGRSEMARWAAAHARSTHFGARS